MKTVTIKMNDLLNEKIVIRTIDASNVYSSGSHYWVLKGENEQRKNIENWINQRGNEQHDTLLELISWELN
jgi:uncharacterized protein YpmB